jgi:hypothetical protein
MATNTTNYGWTKPDYEDDADIAVLNETFDAIDAQVKTVETALNNKQDALTAAQLAAANSGITSADVEQIETNKNNISFNRAELAELIDTGAKNIYKITNVPSVTGVTIAKTDDSTVSINGTFGQSTYVFFTLSGNNVKLPAGEYVVATSTTGTMPARTLTISDNIASVTLGSNAEFTLSAEKPIGVYVQFLSNDAPNGTIRIMICKKSDWQVSNKIVPYCPTLAELYAIVQA